MGAWGSKAERPPPSPGPPSYLQHHGAELPLAVELPCTSQDGGGLSGAGGAIEQEVGQPVLTDEPLDWDEGGMRGIWGPDGAHGGLEDTRTRLGVGGLGKGKGEVVEV